VQEIDGILVRSKCVVEQTNGWKLKRFYF
jgi:hypothetical protein